ALEFLDTVTDAEFVRELQQDFLEEVIAELAGLEMTAEALLFIGADIPSNDVIELETMGVGRFLERERASIVEQAIGGLGDMEKTRINSDFEAGLRFVAQRRGVERDARQAFNSVWGSAMKGIINDRFDDRFTADRRGLMNEVLSAINLQHDRLEAQFTQIRLVDPAADPLVFLDQMLTPTAKSALSASPAASQAVAAQQTIVGVLGALSDVDAFETPGEAVLREVGEAEELAAEQVTNRGTIFDEGILSLRRDVSPESEAILLGLEPELRQEFLGLEVPIDFEAFLRGKIEEGVVTTDFFAEVEALEGVEQKEEIESRERATLISQLPVNERPAAIALTADELREAVGVAAAEGRVEAERGVAAGASAQDVSTLISQRIADLEARIESGDFPEGEVEQARRLVAFMRQFGEGAADRFGEQISRGLTAQTAGEFVTATFPSPEIEAPPLPGFENVDIQRTDVSIFGEEDVRGFSQEEIAFFDIQRSFFVRRGRSEAEFGQSFRRAAQGRFPGVALPGDTRSLLAGLQRDRPQDIGTVIEQAQFSLRDVSPLTPEQIEINKRRAAGLSAQTLEQRGEAARVGAEEAGKQADQERRRRARRQ
ncbi:MAG: hypothetical protein IIC73_02610, partial [Armatimonadetes bacterium]|nr:hypothetical protein [Armatimonadota bacterium]